MTNRRRRQLAFAILRPTPRGEDEDDQDGCALCHGMMSTPSDLEPTAICNLCAQSVALEFAHDEMGRP